MKSGKKEDEEGLASNCLIHDRNVYMLYLLSISSQCYAMVMHKKLVYMALCAQYQNQSWYMCLTNTGLSL